MTQQSIDSVLLDATSPTCTANSVANYYNDTILDYGVWCKEGNLHFGYWRPWLNPFARKPMLEEMNRVIFRHLRLEHLSSGAVADLGCGLGAVSRFGSRLFPQLDFHAISISQQQLAEARRRQVDHRIDYYYADYHKLPLQSNSMDGAFYIESFCYSTAPEQALTEAARVLKPGGRIVLADGFITRPLEKTPRLFQHIAKRVADNWAVPMFHEIELARRWTGTGALRLVDEVECGWRVAPSALHAVHLSVTHFLRLAMRRGVTEWQWRHLLGSAYSIALGLYRRYFRYQLLVFERL